MDMDMNIHQDTIPVGPKVPVGPKGRLAIIPHGWTRITGTNLCKKGDWFANTVTAKFAQCDSEDIGMPAAAFDLLIRRTNPCEDEETNPNKPTK